VDELSAMLSIGALARASGVPVETLRTWERRYGFPAPSRRPSGHRLYPVDCVARLRRIAEALSRGVRAAQAVGASEEALSAMLRAYGRGDAPTPMHPPAASVEDLLGAVQRFDSSAVNRSLVAAWGRLGPLDFLQGCVAPLVREVGIRWERGQLEIRHEHFLSERLGDLLKALRLPLEERADGPLVLLSTLPGEAHALGLHMAALLLVATGCRVLPLGTQTPPEQIAALARDTRARAVGISVSIASRASAPPAVTALRRRLPADTTLLVGGEGAPPATRSIARIAELGDLDDWAREAARAYA
jgi:methanogenic corrinoid protein MtbC1